MHIKKKYLILFPLIFFVLTTSGYALSTVPGSYYYYYLIIPIIGILFYCFKKNCFDFKFSIKPSSAAYLYIVLITIISFLVNLNLSYISTNIKFILVVTFAFLIIRVLKFETFITYYIRVIKAIVIISLIGYVLFNYTKIPFSLSTFKNVNDVEYYNGFIFFAIKSFGVWNNTGLNRNIGAFWEPGLFASFILIALIFEFTIKSKFSKITFIVLMLGLISTNSTFGYLMFIPIFILNVAKNAQVYKLWIIFSVTIIALIISIIYLPTLLQSLYEFKPDLFGKLIYNSVSATERIDAPLTNLKIFLSNPIFGAGIGKTEIIFSSLTRAAQTSTSTYFLATFGIFGIFHIGFLSYGILSYKRVNKFSRILILFIIISLMNKEPHMFFTMSFILIFYFIGEATTLIKAQNETNRRS